MNPTFFNACGTRKCKCLHRVETPRIATSSACTPRFFAIFSAIAPSGICVGSAPSTSSASANRSSSVTRLDIMYELFYPSAGIVRGPAKMIPPTLLSCSSLFGCPARIFQIPCAFPAPAFVAVTFRISPDEGKVAMPHSLPHSPNIEKSRFQTNRSFPPNLQAFSQLPILDVLQVHRAFSRAPLKISGLLRRRGHVFHGNPA